MQIFLTNLLPLGRKPCWRSGRGGSAPAEPGVRHRMRQEFARNETGVRQECARSAPGVRQECAKPELRGARGVREVSAWGIEPASCMRNRNSVMNFGCDGEVWWRW